MEVKKSPLDLLKEAIDICKDPEKLKELMKEMIVEEAKKLEQEAIAAIKAEEEKLKAEIKKKIAKERKKLKKKIKNFFIPKWLFGKGKEPGGIQCLYDSKYREGTWMCICLGTFNIMTGVMVMLVYMKDIFEEAD